MCRQQASDFANCFCISTTLLMVSLCTPTAWCDWPVERGSLDARGAVEKDLPNKLSVLWDYDEAGAFEATPVISNGRVYACDAEGGIYCLSLKDKTEIWKRTVESGFLAAPAIRGDTLVVGDYDGFAYGLSTADGSEKWQYETEGQIDSGATFHGNNVLITSQDGKLTALDIQTGKPQWVYETRDQIRSSPTVAGDRTFLGGCDSQLHVVDLVKGIKASDPMPLNSPTNSTPAVLDDFAFLPTYGGHIIAFNWKENTRLWDYEDANRPQEYRSSPAVAQGLVVVSSQNKRLVALDVKTGEEKWQASIRRYADAAPVIAGQSVFLAATDGRLYRFDLKSGKETWQYEIKGALLAAPAISDGRLVLTTEEGHIMCFGAEGK